jgi:hypothetical protein
MSHTAKIPNVNINDLDALERAAADLGLELVRDQKTYKTYSVQKCDHAIRHQTDRNMYELGVLKEGDHFKLMQDTFMGGKGMVEVLGGHEAPKLNQSYAAQVAMAHYQNEGWNVTTSKLEDGSIVLRALN